MKRVGFITFLAMLTSLFVATGSNAQAQTPQLLGAFKDWAAYMYSGTSGKICYVASQPKDQEPKGVNRDPVFFMVTHRPSEGVRNEASIIIGYPFKEASFASANVDGKIFKMATTGDGAWIHNQAEEGALVSAMRAGSSMVVQGTSRRGTLTTDKYSLSGITAALNKIGESCQ